VVTIPANTTALAGMLRGEGSIRQATPGAYLRLGLDLSAGLVAHYPFDGNANDASGNGHHGTGTGVTLTTDRFGAAEKAYQFNGGSSWIQVAPHADFERNDFTLALWMNVEISATGYTTLLSYPANNSFENAWLVYLDADLAGLKAYLYPGNHLSTPLTWGNVAGSWRHVVFRKAGSQAELYLDGALRVTYPVPASVSYLNSLGLLIGADDDDANGTPDSAWFSGKLDDIRVYSRPLGMLEISALVKDR
jgi:hypothetical protein